MAEPFHVPVIATHYWELQCAPAMAEPGVVGVSSFALCGFGFRFDVLAAGPWRIVAANQVSLISARVRSHRCAVDRGEE